MEQQRKPPYVPFNYFIYTFTRPGQLLFWSLWALLVVGVVWMLVNYYVGEAYVVEWAQLATVRSEIVVVEQVEQNYRFLDQLAPGYSSYISYAATPYKLNEWLLAGLLVFQIVGWSALLAGSSVLKGFWGYALYFLFFFSYFFADLGQMFVGTDPGRAVSLGILLLFLIPAYLFKSNSVRLGVPQQFLVFLALHLGLFGAGAALNGIAALHQLATYTYPVTVLLATATFFMVSKDVTNLVVLLGTNHKDPARRWPLWAVLAGLGVLLLLSSLNFMKIVLGWPVPAPVPPIVLLGLALVVTVFTTQNVYHQLREILPSQLAFSVLILGGGLLTSGLLMYHLGSGETLLKRQVDYLSAYVMFVVGLLHSIYIIVNFGGQIKAKLPVYYALLMPRVMRFAIIWFFAVSGYLLLEGTTGWSGFKYTLSIREGLRGDNAYYQNDTATAVIHYQYATGYSQINPKANYNAAELLVRQQEEADFISMFYQQAQYIGPMPYAQVNYAHYLTSLNRNKAAVAFLRTLDARGQLSPQGMNNLAAYYFGGDKPDSCILLLQKALRLQPDNGLLYSNLGTEYLYFGQMEAAKKYYEAAADVGRDEHHVMANVYFYELMADTVFAQPPTQADTNVTNQQYLYNGSLLAYKLKQYDAADTLAGLLLRQSGEAAYVFLRMLTSAERADGMFDKTFLVYMQQANPEFVALTAHALGVFFFRHRAPEMAAYYLNIAGDNGLVADKVEALRMLVDAGYVNEAYDGFQAMRAAYPEFAIPCTREMNVLDVASGDQRVEAMWAPTNYEILRMGIASKVFDQPTVATNWYTKLVEANPQLPDPYLLMGEIFEASKQMNDTAALIQYDAGIEKFPNNLKLQMARARLLAKMGRGAEAEAVLTKWAAQKDSYDYQWARLIVLRYQKKTTEALKQAEALYKKYPYNPDIILAYADLCQEAKQYKQGYDMILQVLKSNDRNPMIWRAYALLAHGLNLDSAADALDNALELARSEAERDSLSQLLKKISEETIQRKTPTATNLPGMGG